MNPTSQALDELHSPNLTEDIREGLKAALPAFNAAYEKSLSENGHKTREISTARYHYPSVEKGSWPDLHK